MNQLLKIYNFILDLIFPKYCVGCKKEGFWLCDKCRTKIVFIQRATCPICNRLTPEGQFCSRCREKSYLTGVMVAAYYNEGPLKEAIHTFKYNYISDLCKDLGQILVEVLNKRWKRKKIILVPVPLHKKRQAERGFNQAELLARQLINQANGKCAEGIPKDASASFRELLIINKLVRIKQTKKTQVELSGKKRRENVKGIFAWQSKKNELKGKTIILVDDVYTTGSTLQECAKILRRDAGARQIWGVVLAKA